MTGDRERRIRIECRWARETAVHGGWGGRVVRGGLRGEWTEVDGPDVRGEGEGGGDGGGRWCSWSHESFKIVPSLPRKCQADLGRLTSIRLEEATRRQKYRQAVSQVAALLFGDIKEIVIGSIVCWISRCWWVSSGDSYPKSTLSLSCNTTRYAVEPGRAKPLTRLVAPQKG